MPLACCRSGVPTPQPQIYTPVGPVERPALEEWALGRYQFRTVRYRAVLNSPVDRINMPPVREQKCIYICGFRDPRIGSSCRSDSIAPSSAGAGPLATIGRQSGQGTPPDGESASARLSSRSALGHCACGGRGADEQGRQDHKRESGRRGSCA